MMQSRSLIFLSATAILLSALTAGVVWSGAHAAPGAQAGALPFADADTGQALGRGSMLGRAANFAILAKSGIATVPTSQIRGNLGISPAAASFITGFGLTMHSSNLYSTSAQVLGRVFAADYAPPVPTGLTLAVLDMEAAYAAAAGRAPDVTELGAGDIGGMTLAPGTYSWSTGLLVPTDVTLSGGPTDFWVFQVAQNLTIGDDAEVILAGGALSANVVWQVAGLVEVGTSARMHGNVLSATSITLATGAMIRGRLLAQTAVNLDGSVVVTP